MTLATHGFAVTVYSRDREPNASADIVKAIGGKYISSLDCTIEQMAAAIGEIDLVYEATGASQLPSTFSCARPQRPLRPHRRARQPRPARFDTDAIMRNHGAEKPMPARHRQRR